MSSGKTDQSTSLWSLGGIRYHALWVSTDCFGADLHFSVEWWVCVCANVVFACGTYPVSSQYPRTSSSSRTSITPAWVANMMGGTHTYNCIIITFTNVIVIHGLTQFAKHFWPESLLVWYSRGVTHHDVYACTHVLHPTLNCSVLCCLRTFPQVRHSGNVLEKVNACVLMSWCSVVITRTTCSHALFLFCYYWWMRDDLVVNFLSECVRANVVCSVVITRTTCSHAFFLFCYYWWVRVVLVVTF